ncbi:hypothetical protein [Peribacillus muralis]|uniref:hypothetical protein n=1 Tax=Peribacillus muralis TaxID=264697 RepID=UPI003672C7C2
MIIIREVSSFIHGSNEIDLPLISTLLFGMTGGLLSLVGLIAIFVSINTQQSVEKAKDLLAELQSFELNHELGDRKNGRRLKWILEHYKRQVQLNISSLSV